MDREEKKHLKRIQGKISEMRDNQIYNSLPDNDVFQDQTAIKVINGRLGLDDQEIADSLNRLIEKRKLVTSFDTRNKLYLRKNPFT
jgi:hypothetical protein